MMKHFTKYSRTKVIGLTLAISLLGLGGCERLKSYTDQEYLQKAKTAQSQGNLKEAVIDLKNALQKNPNNAEARWLLGEAYVSLEQGREAEKELKRAQELGVNPESLKVAMGQALLLQRFYQRVLNEIKAGPDSSQTNLARISEIQGRAYLGLAKLDQGCPLFQQSLAKDADYVPAYWGLAQCAVADKNMSKARALLDAALKIKDEQAKTWVFIGAWEQLNKNTQAALVAYTNALKSDPNNLEALQNRIDLNIALGQLETAKIDIEKISKLAPKSLVAEYTQALLAFNQKKYPQARDALENVFQITPDYMPSVLLAGVTAYTLGSYQQAESYLNRYLSNFPNQAYARRVLAATFIKQNQPNKALATLAPILTPDSKDAQALALAGEAQFMTQNPAQTTQFFDRAIALDPKNASIRTQQGMNLLISGNTLGAVNQLETAAALDPDQYQADSLLVASLLQSKEYDKALAAIDAMEKKLPRSPITYNLRGNAYLGKNDLVNARKNFEQALAIDAAFFPAAANLAQLDLRDNKPDAARKRFEAVLEKDKNNVQAMVALAELAAVQKQEQEYVRWLEKAAETAPDAILPRAKLADYYLAKKDKAKALNVVRELVNAYPNSHDALDLLGATQLAAGDNESALATYAKLVEKAPNAPAAYLRLAMAQTAAKKVTEARASLNKALELQPDFPQARDALIRLDLAENKGDEALKIARQMQTQQPKSPAGYDNEADILMAQKQYAQAVKAYEQALARGAGPAGLIKLHRALTLAGDGRAAEQSLTAWIKQNPTDVAVRGYAADYYMVSNRNRDAIAQYEELLKLAPQSALAFNNLANLYQRERDGRALATAEQALKLAPDNPRVQDTLGWILVEQGQLPRAIELLRKAVTNVPQAGVIHYHLAVALARSGQKAEAKKELEAAIGTGQKFPELDDAKAMLKGL